ncbi:MAG: glycosyltransferase family 39 protein [Ardenticatenaceae bacterium]|nr:glycosyltransferase family 39 protein [Ardenticatenaceae bacterium]
MSNIQVNKGRRYGRILLIFLGYALLTIVMTWPAAGQLGTHIPGIIGDSYVHLWTFTWLKEHIFQLTSLDAFYTNQIYYPAGVSLLNHNLAWVNFAIWLPFQAIFGPETGYTIAFLLIFPFNGIAAYLLGKELGLAETAAFLAGLMTAFWPYNLSHHGHPNLLLIAWVLFALLYLHRLGENSSWRNAVWFGLFLGLIGLTRWQLLIMAAPIIGIYALWILFQNRGKQLWGLIQKIIVSGLISLLMMLPFLTPLLLFQTGRDNPTEVIIDEFNYPTDLLAYFIPGSYHPIWGDSILPITQNFVGNYIYSRTVGYIALALVLIGIFKQWPRAKIWFGLLLVYFLLALGSDLYIGGQPTIPLPFRLIENSFLIQALRFPDRFNVILVIPFGLLAGLGLEQLLQRSGTVKRARWIAGLICLLVLFEYANVFQMHSVAIPAWYQQVAADEETYALLDIPSFTREKFNSQYMRFQLFHGKPLITGNIARTPAESLALFNSIPLLVHIKENRDAPTDIVNPARQMKLLADADVRYVILHKEHLSENDLQNWKTWFVEPPWYEDEEVVVYFTGSTAVGKTVPLEEVLVGSQTNPELGLISAKLNGEATQGSWLQLNTIWGNIDASLPAADLSMCLKFAHTTSEYASEACRPVSVAWPTSRWQSDAIVWADYQFQIDPFAEPGMYQVWLSLQNQQNKIFGQPALIDTIEIDPLARQFEPGQPQETIAAQWQALFFLDGFDVASEANSLAVSLYWHVPQRVEKSYKFFIHLIDLESGELVAQTDFVPRDWTYPTNWWEAGEVVVDTAVLPLETVGNGTYQLLVGIYDPDTGERLLATTPENINPVDALLLTEINR